MNVSRIVLHALVAAVFSAAPATAAPLRESALRVGLPRVAFGNLNENDATAAYRAFLRSMGRQHGYALEPEVSIYDTVPQLERAIRSGRLHMIVMNSWMLLTGGLQDAVDVVFVPLANRDAMKRVLLIVHRDSGATRLADLRDKSILVLLNANATLGRPWLETSTLAEGLGYPAELFERIDTVAKPNAAILPVFFRRADACVVDEATLAVASELNPQLRRDLVVLAQSEPMLEGLICLNRIGWDSPDQREALLASLPQTHADPAGRQILTLFRIEKLVPFEPHQLESVTALAARHARLVARFAQAAPSDALPPFVAP